MRQQGSFPILYGFDSSNVSRTLLTSPAQMCACEKIAKTIVGECCYCCWLFRFPIMANFSAITSRRRMIYSFLLLLFSVSRSYQTVYRIFCHIRKCFKATTKNHPITELEYSIPIHTVYKLLHSSLSHTHTAWLMTIVSFILPCNYRVARRSNTSTLKCIYV